MPANKVASLYLVGPSFALTREMPFYKVSNYEYGWPLRCTIPLGGGGVDLKDCGWGSSLQGVWGPPPLIAEASLDEGKAQKLRTQVIEKLLELHRAVL